MDRKARQDRKGLRDPLDLQDYQEHRDRLEYQDQQEWGRLALVALSARVVRQDPQDQLDLPDP